MGSLLMRRAHAADAPGGASAIGHQSSFRPYDDPDRLKGSEILKVLHAVHIKHSALMELKLQLEASQADVERLESAAQESHEDWCQVQNTLKELHAEHEQQLLEVENKLQKSELESQANSKHNTELEQQLAAEKEQLAIIEDAKGVADKRIQNAEAAAQAADTQRSNAEAHAQYRQQQLEQELAAQKASAAELSAQYTRLKCELSQSQERITSLSAQAARDHELLQTDNAGLADANAVQAAELQQSKATQAELGSTVQEMIANVGRLEQAIATVSATKTQIQADLDRAHENLHAIEDMSCSNNALTERVGQLESELQTANDSSKHVGDDLAQASERLSQERSRWSAQEAQLQQQIDDLKSTVQRAEQTSEEAVAEQQLLQDASTQAQQTMEQQQRELQQHLEGLQSELAQTQSQQQKFQSDAVQQQEQILQLQDELAQEQQAHSALRSEKTSLLTDLEAAQKAARDSDRRHVEEQQQSLQTQLDNATELLSAQKKESQDELSCLRDEVAALKTAAETAQNHAATERQGLEQQLRSSIRQEVHEEYEQEWNTHLQEVKSEKQQILQREKDSTTHAYSRNEEVRSRHITTITAHYAKELRQAEADRVQQVTRLQEQINRLRHAPPDSPPQAKRRRSAAQAHPRRSSATPKRAELNEQDAAPSTAALPAQQMADDAQQDEMQMESSQGGATAGSPAGPAAGSPAGEAMDSQAGSGHQSDPSERQAPRTLASRISRFAEIFTGCKSTADTPTGGIQEAEAEQAGPSQPTATQAEEAQGFESSQEELTQPEAPLAADSNQSRVKATRGRGRGRGRGRSSRPAADRKSDGIAVAGTKDPKDAPGSSHPDPPKRGRGRPRGSTRAAAASSAATASVNPADADTEGQHGAAPEPAGPAEDDAYAQGPQTRRRRTTSVSQAISAAAAGVDDFSTAPDADTDAAAAVQSDAPKARCGSKVQGEAPKFRRGRSRSSSSVSQLKQKEDATDGGDEGQMPADAPSRGTRAASRSRASSAAAEMRDTAGTKAGRRKRKPILEAIEEEEEDAEEDVQVTKRARKESRAAMA